MGLGTITNVAQRARATNTSQNGARGPDEARTSGGILDDDAAAAVIRNGRRAEELDAGQGAVDTGGVATLGQRIREFTTSFAENLARYKKLSERVGNGRFSPKSMRDQIEAIEEAAGIPGRNLLDSVSGRNSASTSPGSDDSNSASKGITDTRALTWLKDQAQQALLSQKNVEPGRVLRLLRGMISGADWKQAVIALGQGVFGTVS